MAEVKSRTNFQVNKLQKQLNLLSFLIIVALIINYGFFALILNKSKLETQQVQSNVSSKSIAKNNPTVQKDSKAKITNFYNNLAVSEIGYQLDVQKQSISTKNTTNCFTPIVPPLKNGCNFTVRPYSAGVDSKSSYLLNLVLEGQIGLEDRLVINKYNTAKGEITSQDTIIEGKYDILRASIEPRLEKDEQILVRLWPKNSSIITVSGIYIEYFEINRLNSISLKMNSKTYDMYKGYNLSLYLDKNKNGKLDENIDFRWNCNNEFPGVNKASITSENLTLTRDDSCIRANLPLEWQDDRGINALPNYNWLVVIENAQSVIVAAYPIETVDGKTNYEI